MDKEGCASKLQADTIKRKATQSNLQWELQEGRQVVRQAEAQLAMPEERQMCSVGESKSYQGGGSRTLFEEGCSRVDHSSGRARHIGPATAAQYLIVQHDGRAELLLRHRR